MAAPLALPSGSDSRPRSVALLGVISAYVAGLMAVGGVAAAWLQVRREVGASQWPPDGVEHIDNYPGSILTITAVMLAVVVSWAAVSIRRNERGQAMAGLALTALLGLAFLNVVWFVGSSLGNGPGGNTYGLLVHAFLVLVGVMTVAALLLTAATIARTAGGQVSSAAPEMAASTAWAWYFTGLAWTVVFLTVYVPDLLF